MATRRGVVWSERALAALDEILTYIAKDSPSAARSVAAQALEQAASLETLAERGRVVPEVSRPSIREVFVHSYRLIYRVESQRITVLAVVHGARDFERWRQDEEL